MVENPFIFVKENLGKFFILYCEVLSFSIYKFAFRSFFMIFIEKTFVINDINASVKF